MSVGVEIVFVYQIGSLYIYIQPSLMMYTPQRSRDIALHGLPLPLLHHLYGAHTFAWSGKTIVICICNENPSPRYMFSLFQTCCSFFAITGKYALMNFKISPAILVRLPQCHAVSLKCCHRCGLVILRLLIFFFIVKHF